MYDYKQTFDSFSGRMYNTEFIWVPEVKEKRLPTAQKVGLVIGVTIIGSYIGSKVRSA